MDSFEIQSDGSFLGVLTERAIAWADGNKDHQAFIGFAGFCRDAGLDPFWATDDPSVIAMTIGGVVRIHRDVSAVYDEFCVEQFDTTEGWDAIVRVLDGASPLIHVLGLSGTLIQHSRPGQQTARGRLCKVSEWLSQWPHHRKREAA